MLPAFRHAAVLGAGTMGAQIAAHFANAGLDVVLLDVSREAADAGVRRLKTLRPDPCFVAEVLARITTGGFDTDSAALTRADWVVEAVVESVDVKQGLLSTLAPHLSSDTVVSTNTSGIPVGTIAAGLPATLRPRFLGTHFFNPPRYMRLLELIRSPDTAPAVAARVADFADRRLGKGIVMAKDTPGFIANRIGLFAVIRALEQVVSGEFTIEEVDAITGPIIGRPKSATFRTVDLAGVDVLAKVASDLASRLPEGPAAYALPPLVTAMLERGQTGAKSGQGFYRRMKADGDSVILVLDPSTLDYRPSHAVRLPAIERVEALPDSRARLLALLEGRDRVAGFLWRTLGATLRYAWQIAPEISGAPADIDRAMRLGFGWEHGPFELIDAIGIDRLLETTAGDDRLGGRPAPPREGWPATADAVPALPTIARARARPGALIRSSAGASLVAVDDDVLAVEFHSKMNTLGGDAVAMLRAGVEEAARNFGAIVIANDGDQFSAGANLMLVLLEAQEGNWDEIDAMIRAFQAATMAIKTSPVPVVAAPAGLALGGGCEVCLHAARVRAAAETYMGLVEVGVGLLPAGGGTKEMLIRAIDRAGAADPAPFVRSAFETIGFGRVSTSAPDARRLGYLDEADAVTMNRERLLGDAVREARTLAAGGYQPVTPRAAIPVGGPDACAALRLGLHLAHRAGRITDHELTIGRLLARVLTGGDIPHRTTVSEQTLLDLERESFLSLCGERKTLERIAYTLRTGRTLRN